MLTLDRRTDRPATDRVALSYDERKRSRLRVTLASGSDAGIFLERGEHLHGGDRLAGPEGEAVIEIVAAPEQLIEATADSPLLFARAAYHLGNRHVPVQIILEAGGGRLRFQADHVLAAMLTGLGCRIAEIQAPFEPEPGAYSGGGHHHHDPAHGHDHDHAHGHGYRPSAHADLHDPGHGPHRTVPRIHEFKPG